MSNFIDVITSASSISDNQVYGNPPLDKMKVASGSEQGKSTASPLNDAVSPILGGETRRTEKKPEPKSLKHADDYRVYREICTDLVAILRGADDYIVDGVLQDSGSGIIVEVEVMLDRLYDCIWGKKESLKRVVLAIRSQINNTDWTKKHIGFLRDISRYLKITYNIDESSVSQCYEFMRQYDLPIFRGTITSTPTLKQYRIEEVR